ncbi:MAG: 3'-5' exonuclease [Flavobacteriales bacterium]|nr:3'-5' exonuclease [Flavobacteriales bacterium]
MSVVFLDTETNGLPINWDAPATDTDNWPRLVQIAWIVCDSKLNVVDHYSTTVFPEFGVEIPDSSVKVHGISERRACFRGTGRHHVLWKFVSVMEKAEYIIGHNIDFDLNVIRAEIERYNQKQLEEAEKEAARNSERYQDEDDYEYEDFADNDEPDLIEESFLDDVEIICTMRSTTDWCGIEDPNGSYKWPTLEELYFKTCKKQLSNIHDARVDVFALRECFISLVSHMETCERANVYCSIDFAFDKERVEDEKSPTDKFEYSYKYFLDGLKAEENENLSLAYWFYNEAAKLDPTNARILHRLGLSELFFLEKAPDVEVFPDYEEFEDYYCHQFEFDWVPDDECGLDFVRKYGKTIDRFRKAVDLDPNLFEAKVDFAESVIDMIDVLYNKNRCYDHNIEEINSMVSEKLLPAYSAASKASKIDKANVEILFLKAVLAVRIFQFEAAGKLVIKDGKKLLTEATLNATRKDFETVISEERNHSRAHIGLGELLMLNLEQPDLALKHLNKGLEYQPYNDTVRFIRAKLKEAAWCDEIGLIEDEVNWDHSSHYKWLFDWVTLDYSKTEKLQFINGSIHEIPFNHNCKDILSLIEKGEFQVAWETLANKKTEIRDRKKKTLQNLMDLSVIAKMQLHLVDRFSNELGLTGFDSDETEWKQLTTYAQVQSALQNDFETVAVCNIALDLAYRLSKEKGPLYKWRGEALLRLNKLVEGYEDLRKYEDYEYQKWWAERDG